jgi:hypothetical protein
LQRPVRTRFYASLTTQFGAFTAQLVPRHELRPCGRFVDTVPQQHRSISAMTTDLCALAYTLVSTDRSQGPPRRAVSVNDERVDTEQRGSESRLSTPLLLSSEPNLCTCDAGRSRSGTGCKQATALSVARIACLKFDGAPTRHGSRASVKCQDKRYRPIEDRKT